MAFNRFNNNNNFGGNNNIVAQILKQAQAEFLYLFDGQRLTREQVIQLAEGLNNMGKSLKAFINRPRDLGQVPGNLFYIDTLADLESAEQFGRENSAHIMNFQIIHNPKR